MIKWTKKKKIHKDNRIFAIAAWEDAVLTFKKQKNKCLRNAIISPASKAKFNISNVTAVVIPEGP